MCGGGGVYLQREAQLPAERGQPCEGHLREEEPSTVLVCNASHPLTTIPQPWPLVPSLGGRLLLLGIPWDRPDPGCTQPLCAPPSSPGSPVTGSGRCPGPHLLSWGPLMVRHEEPSPPHPPRMRRSQQPLSSRPV